MKNNNLIYTIFFILGLYVTVLKAQESIPASGGNATGNGGSVSFSVGQVLYTSATGTTGSESKGVQQPYEISVVTAAENARNFKLKVSAFPNPTTQIVQLLIENYNVKNLYYQLTDMNGKLLEGKKPEGTITTIIMGNLASGNYLLKVFDKQKEIITFNIIKN